MSEPLSQAESPVLRRQHSKPQLESLSADEQALFLTIAHIMNEINALLRAAVWSDNRSTKVQAEGDGQITLTLLFLRVLAGKLNEA